MSETISITHPDELTAVAEEYPSSQLHLELVLLQPLGEDDDCLSDPVTTTKKPSTANLSRLSKAWRENMAELPADRISRITFNTRLPEQSQDDDPSLCRQLYWDSTAPAAALVKSDDNIAVVDSRDFFNLAIVMASVLHVRCKGKHNEDGEDGKARVSFDVVHEAPGMMNGAVNDLRKYLAALSTS